MSRYAPASTYVLAYDSDCGPCRSLKRLVSFLDPGGSIEYVSLREADREGLLDPVPHRSRYASAHLILPGGGVLSGARAMPKILELLPGGFLTSRVAGGWGPGRRLTRFVYVAASRLHGADDCR